MSNDTATLLGVLVHVLDFVLVPLPLGRYFFASTAHLALALHPTLVDIETKVGIHCYVQDVIFIYSLRLPCMMIIVVRFLQLSV